MDFVLSNIEILIYIGLWIYLLCSFIKHDRYVSLGVSLIMLYTIQAIVALFVLNHELSDYKDLELKIFPFIYLFIMIFISMKPILGLREGKLRYIEIPNDRMATLLCVFFAVFSIISIIKILPEIQFGFTQMLLSDNEEGIIDIYNESTEAKNTHASSGGMFNIQGVLSNMSNFITPLLFFTYFLKKNKNSLVMLMLIIALLQGPLTGVANASRQQLIAQVFTFFLLFFFFRPYMNKNLKKAFNIGFISFVSVLVLVFISITIARTSLSNKNDDSIYNLEAYFSQGPINFNAYCMDANGTREGYRVAPLILQIVGKESLSPEQVKDKYHYMKIDSSSFTTYVGDFVLDFGPIMAFIIFVVLSGFFSIVIRHHTGLSYGQVIAVYVLAKFCSGYYQYGFSNIGGNLAFVMLIILMFLFLKKSDIYNNPEIVIRQS